MTTRFVRQIAIGLSTAAAIAVTALTLQTQQTVSAHAKGCTTVIAGTTYEGGCVNDEFACGCATADGQLGQSASCGCTQ